jgi:hypothetical protein
MAGHAISIDDHGVRRELADCKVEQVAWPDLREEAFIRVMSSTEDATFVCWRRRGS